MLLCVAGETKTVPEIFKIRNPDGLFSTGGTDPTFTKEGKTWQKKGHLSNHFANFNERQMFKHYAGCEVVTYEVTQTEVRSEIAEVHLRASADRQRKREAEYRQYAAKAQRDRAMADLKRLALQYPDLVKLP